MTLINTNPKFQNISTFDLQRKHMNQGVIAFIAATLYLATRWGWAVLVPIAVINLLLPNANQPANFTLLAIAFFAYLLSFALPPPYQETQP